MVRGALLQAFRKLHPRTMLRTPVMFVVEAASVLMTVLWVFALAGAPANASSPDATGSSAGYAGTIALILWCTVLSGNFSEALAEGRGRAHADALRNSKRGAAARRLKDPRKPDEFEIVPASDVRPGDLFLVKAGEVIPADGEVEEGIALVDESAITGESAPVVRESGGDRSAVTGGTKLLSDWLVIRSTAGPGGGFLDRMIGLIEGAERRRTVNELALHVLLTACTIIFLVVCATLLPFSLFSVEAAGRGMPVSITVLVSLLVCLIPTTIGGLVSAVGIAGMDRMIRHNVIATSGRAVEAAGDVDVLLLDKTGTITFGNRMATEFIPAPGVPEERLADAAQAASLADETPEGRSIVVLAKEKYGLRGRQIHEIGARFVPFTARLRMSGVDMTGTEGPRVIRKGATDAIRVYLSQDGRVIPDAVLNAVKEISRRGGTPLVVAENGTVLGIVHLKDVVKGGIRERFARLHGMGIRTVMITGDNPLTAAAIAAEAGVDDFLAEARPEDKLELIRTYQKEGRMVAMTGDGTNDAPALAQADVAVAMNTGTQSAREAANMIDLDSNPTKLLEIVDIGKQLLMTRGALTTFSIANDVAKYFAIVPAAFATTYPALEALNIMRLTTPGTAVLSAVVFNALVLLCLVPLALRGVAPRREGAAGLLRRHLLVYGVGGLAAPFLGIKVIDLLIAAMGVR
ncbi:MAG: potassium-transporting ATPase subunit KdpB [Bacteroidota bacterium]